jgi:hypothetical protein
MARRPQTAGGKRTALAMRAATKRAPSNTGEDDEEEDSHSSAASSESEQQTDDGGGKQQAGAYEETYEVDTDEEVTSLTSPRAKITKNEFTAIHVRNTTTSKVFRTVKFLNTPSLIESTMTQMARVYVLISLPSHK